MTIAKTSLWYYFGSSDKIYVATVTENNGRFTVKGEWGRRGKNLQSQIKGEFASKHAAIIAYNSLVDSKTGKGYQVTEKVA